MTDLAFDFLFASSPAAAPFAPRRCPSEKPSGASAPTRRKSRRPIPSQWGWTRLLSLTSSMKSLLVVEDEFLGVQERPHQVAPDVGPVALLRRERLPDRLLLRRARKTGERREEEPL